MKIINIGKTLILKINRKISLSIFITIIAIYQATYLNSTYYQQVFDLLLIKHYRDLLFFITMPIVVFCVIFSLLNLFILPKLIKFIAIILILISASCNYFMSTYHIMIDRDMLQNVLDATKAESRSLITSHLLIHLIIFVFIPTLWIVFCRIKPIKKYRYFLICRILSILISIITILGIAFFFYKDYATFMRNNSNVIKYLTPSNYIGAIYNQYNYLKYQNLPFVELGDDAHRQLQNDSNHQKKIIILVLGETSRAKNFSLNGYEKETNPQLKKQNIIYFNQVSSCGTATEVSVPCMFSNMPRSEYNAKIVSKQSNVLDILHKTGVQTLWIDNDGGCKGVCDRIDHIDATQKYQNMSKLCHDDICYDEILFKDLDKYIENTNEDTLIILHTIGSHGPTYYERYPDQYKTFTPTCDSNAINYCSSEKLTNTYDNTIVYVDSIVNHAINLLRKYDDNYNLSVLYLSDHGESLGENHLYLHGMPYSIAPKEQTEIPLLLWFSDKFQKELKIDRSCLMKNAKQNYYSQDNLFHSLLGMFNVKTNEYDPNLDLLSNCHKK